MKRAAAATSLAASLALTLSACSGEGGSAYVESTGSWASCPLSDQPDRTCQLVASPLGEGSNGTVRIAVAKSPARKPDQRLGTLVLDPGGPNVSGLSFGSGANIFLPEEILDRFDIVSYDRRGVGRSQRLDCGEQPEVLETLSEFENLPEITDYAPLDNAAKAYVDSCKDKTGGLVLNTGSKVAATDLENIRRALGEEKLHLLMYSYGTLVGQAYQASHPDRVAKMVLDGVVDPAQSGAAFAAANNIELSELTNVDDGRGQPSIPPEKLKEAQELQEQGFTLGVDQGYHCADFSWGSSVEEVSAALRSTVKEPGVGPVLLQDYASCSRIQRANAVLGEVPPGKGAPKALVVNSAKDPRTPLAGARKVADRLGADLVEVPGNRHVVTGFGLPCATETATAYLTGGTVDAQACTR